MGYQESMIPIGCLAEAEGIKDGIESYRRVHGCGLFYYCAASERYTGQLYACVGGDRYPYQSMPGPFPMIYLDDILGWDGEQAYGDHFDDLSQADVLADVPMHLEEMFLARSNMIEYLRSVDREMEADSVGGRGISVLSIFRPYRDAARIFCCGWRWLEPLWPEDARRRPAL